MSRLSDTQWCLVKEERVKERWRVGMRTRRKKGERYEIKNEAER